MDTTIARTRRVSLVRAALIAFVLAVAILLGVQIRALWSAAPSTAVHPSAAIAHRTGETKDQSVRPNKDRAIDGASARQIAAKKS